MVFVSPGLKESMGLGQAERALVHDILVGERFAWSIRKLLLLTGSAGVALGMAAVPGAEAAFAALGALEWAGVLIAGALFSYGFTTLPAISALFLLSGTLPPVGVAAVGAAAAMVSDLLLFRFARNSLREEAGFLRRLFHLHPHLGKGSHRALRAVSPLIAGLVLASPLPDEVAAALLGSGTHDWRALAALSYVFKFFAILLVASAARLV